MSMPDCCPVGHCLGCKCQNQSNGFELYVSMPRSEADFLPDNAEGNEVAFTMGNRGSGRIEKWSVSWCTTREDWQRPVTHFLMTSSHFDIPFFAYGHPQVAYGDNTFPATAVKEPRWQKFLFCFGAMRPGATVSFKVRECPVPRRCLKPRARNMECQFRNTSYDQRSLH